MRDRTTMLAAGVIAAGVALRLLGLAHGLPEFTDEAAPFRWALAMWARPDGTIDPDPRHFIYPSLTIYLHLAVQRLHALLGQLAGVWPRPADYHLAFAIDPTPMAIAARSVGIVADGVSILLLVRIGERLSPRAGLLAAAAFALSPLAITLSHDVFTDPVMLAFSLLAIDRMLGLSAAGGRRGLLLASCFLGLAIGSKYTAAVLVLPFVVACLSARGARRGLLAALAGLGATALVFVATTPYALIDRAAFLRDVRFDGVLASEGLLGATGSADPWSALTSLAHDLGIVGGLLAVAGAALAIRQFGTDRRPLVVLLAGLAFLAPVLASPLTFDRYRLPVVACAALLAGYAAVRGIAGESRPRWAAVSAVLLLLAPIAAPAWTAARSRGGTTAGAARAWCEANLGPGELVLLEPYAPALLSTRQAALEASSPLARNGSPEWRERYERRRSWQAYALPTLVAGTCAVDLTLPDGGTQAVTVFEHASDLDRVLYDERLLAGVDVMITSSAQRGRFEADSVRYADACAFYRHLDEHYPVVARFESDADHSGPMIAVHRRAAGTPEPEPLPRDWWTQRMPEEYRLEATRLLSPDDTASVRATAGPDGEPAPWVQGLVPLYATQFARFAESLAHALIELDRPAPAQRLMLAELWVMPRSQWACLLAVEASVGLGDWESVRDAVERTRAATPKGPLDPALLSREAEAQRHITSRPSPRTPAQR